ncbi:phosphoglycerate kinase [Robiginitomaculum antarcticum]|uniref:phosphoglycerate kinase n=1 Tax=Robiginitomaculum antarcticum TaxID=437507 RepID=UPI00036BB825|nr:phosphoglycerate kinase [Robiginitomaculum antarcticum]
MKFRRLENASLDNKTALVRVDFNVPVTEGGGIADDTRLRAAVPTIQALQEAGAKIVLLSHFGRPKGRIDPSLSLGFLTDPLAALLGSPVTFCEDLTGQAARDAVKALNSGDVLLMENTRFLPGETANDPKLSAQVATLGDVFIQDAFSAAHRAHMSSAGLADYLPAYAGLAMERELDHLSQALDHPKPPVMAVVGGAKVSTKIDLLQNLVSKLDILVIGGGMANTFLAAKGVNVGASLCEHDLADTARQIMAAASNASCEIMLPVDVVVAKEFKAYAASRVCAPQDVASDEMILDAGPETVNAIADAMDRAKTLIWNGPLGAFELEPFDTATVEAAQYAAKRTRDGKLISVAGGGDTVSALNHAGVADDFTFISTAGGAFLEWMEGKALPGVTAISN